MAAEPLPSSHHSRRVFFPRPQYPEGKREEHARRVGGVSLFKLLRASRVFVASERGEK